MLAGWVIVAASAAYLGLLFAVAWYADRRADARRSVIASPWVYALSLGVHATSWTFHGSVGRAAETGIGFLPVYLGPTLVAVLWVVVVGRMRRIAHVRLDLLWRGRDCGLSRATRSSGWARCGS